MRFEVRRVRGERRGLLLHRLPRALERPSRLLIRGDPGAQDALRRREALRAAAAHAGVTWPETLFEERLYRRASSPPARLPPVLTGRVSSLLPY